MTHAAAGRELQVRYLRKDGRSVAMLRAVDYGGSCVVEAEVFPQSGGLPERPGPVHVRRHAPGDRVRDRRRRGADVPRLRRRRAMIRRPIKLWLGAALLAAVWSGVALGAFTAEAVAPPNDNFASAIVADRRDGHALGRHERRRDACSPARTPTVAGAAGGASVWYSWTAPLDGKVVIDTATSDFDTLLGVYTGNAVGRAGRGREQRRLHPRRRRAACGSRRRSARVYRIRVDGYRGATGIDPPARPPGAASRQRRLRRRDRAQRAERVAHRRHERRRDAGDGRGGHASPTPTRGASVWYEWTAPVTGEVDDRHRDEQLRHAARRLHRRAVDSLDRGGEQRRRRRCRRRASSASRRRPEPSTGSESTASPAPPARSTSTSHESLPARARRTTISRTRSR